MPEAPALRPRASSVARRLGAAFVAVLVTVLALLLAASCGTPAARVPTPTGGATDAHGATDAPVTSAPAPGTAAATRGAAPATSRPDGPLVVVGLGDSVVSAETCACDGYVEQLGTRLAAATGRRTVVHNDATGGWTTADVENGLATPQTRSDLARADLVVIEVGANDFDLGRVDDPTCLPADTSPCWSDTLAGVRSGVARIVGAVRAADRTPGLRVAVLGYWNVTVDGAVGRERGEDFVTGSDALTRSVNAVLEQVATSTGSLYVDAYAALKGASGTRDPSPDLLDDGDHPDAAGHTRLMQATYRVLVDAGAVRSWSSD